MKVNYFGSVQLAKREYDKTLDPICKQWSLTRNELDILLFLYNHPHLNRAADLVNYRGMVKSHVSLSVRTLKEKGLLQQNPFPDDRRAVRLELTDNGSRIAAEAKELQHGFFEKLFRGLTPEEMELWLAIIKKVENNIQNL